LSGKEEPLGHPEDESALRGFGKARGYGGQEKFQTLDMETQASPAAVAIESRKVAMRESIWVVVYSSSYKLRG